MIKFVRQKSRENSVTASKSCFKIKKGESNDSGTESDGDILDADKHHQFDLDMETSLSSCADANASTDTACSSASSAMMCQSHLLYDQHSSEEELEVINGPSSVAAAEKAAAGSVLIVRGTTASSSLVSERGSSSLEPEEQLFGEAASTTKRSSSTLIENRKRSLAHSSDDELRNFLEPILTPVNFRTSPPLEAFKPNRSHMFRSTTPLILSEARCGIENIKLCDNSVNDENGDKNIGGQNNEANSGASCAGGSASCSSASGGNNNHNKNNIGSSNNSGAGGGNGDSSVIKISSLKMSTSSHHIYQPQPKYNFQYNSSRSSPASTTGLDADVVRSVSPPAKLFHCAISPRRRPMRSAQHGSGAGGGSGSSAAQRLQRPHRPCLDFDKMQQVSL